MTAYALSKSWARPEADTADFATATAALEVFKLRCWARSRLYAEGLLDLHDAVDVLQVAAERDGLIAELGQNTVQKIMATAFKESRQP